MDRPREARDRRSARAVTFAPRPAEEDVLQVQRELRAHEMGAEDVRGKGLGVQRHQRHHHAKANQIDKNGDGYVDEIINKLNEKFND